MILLMLVLFCVGILLLPLVFHVHKKAWKKTPEQSPDNTSKLLHMNKAVLLNILVLPGITKLF